MPAVTSGSRVETLAVAEYFWMCTWKDHRQLRLVEHVAPRFTGSSPLTDCSLTRAASTRPGPRWSKLLSSMGNMFYRASDMISGCHRLAALHSDSTFRSLKLGFSNVDWLQSSQGSCGSLATDANNVRKAQPGHTRMSRSTKAFERLWQCRLLGYLCWLQGFSSRRSTCSG